MQIKAKTLLCSAPQAHKENICVYLRAFAFSFSFNAFDLKGQLLARSSLIPRNHESLLCGVL